MCALGQDRVRCRRRAPVGWVERLARNPSPASLRARGFDGFRVPLNPSYEASIFTISNSAVSSFPRRIAASGFSAFLFPGRLRRSVGGYVCRSPCRCEPPRPRGGGAPGGGILIPVALVRRDTTFAKRGRPGQTGTGLAALHLAVLGPLRAVRPRSCLRLPCAGDLRCRVSRPVGRRSRTSRARFTSRGRDATPRSAFRIVSGDAPR